MIDHQMSGETGSGHSYLYKIDDNGRIHNASLNIGPDDIHLEDNPDEDEHQYGTVPKNNWRHSITGEGGIVSVNPEGHDSLRDLVDDEAFRSSDPTNGGYKDFEVPDYMKDRIRSGDEDKWRAKLNHTVRRAWETGTNQPDLHWKDPMPDPYANIESIPRGQKPVRMPDEYNSPQAPASKHPRYGSAD
jgi:hypothetical protein